MSSRVQLALNVDSLDTFELTSSTTDDAAWVGQFFAYGGSGADQSTAIYFAMPPGKRLGDGPAGPAEDQSGDRPRPRRHRRRQPG